MSVREPTSKDKTGPHSSVAEKIKSLRERKKKLNPLSPANKKITQQIKKLEQSQKPVSKKFTGSGKEIGDAKTKTGQYKEKPPKVKKELSANEKRTIETRKLAKQSRTKLNPQSKRLREKRLYESKRKDIKTYPHKSETSTDDAKTHMIKLQAQGKDATVVGDARGSTVVVTSGKLSQDQTNRAKAALAKRTKKKTPYQKMTPPGKAMPKKVVKPVSKKVEKPKTKDMSVWDTIKNIGSISKVDKRKVPSTKMSRSARLIAAQDKRKAMAKKLLEEDKIRSAKAKQQAALEAKAGPLRPDVISKSKPTAKRVGPLRPDVISKSKPTAKRVGPLRPDPTITKKKPVVPIGVPKRKPTLPVSKVTPPGAKRSIRRGRSPGELGGKIKQPISMGKAMSDRPEGRRSRTIAEDKADFLKSKGGTDEDLNKGFGFNLFGKNKSAAEAKKAGDEAYLAEQEDRKKASQQDFYQYGEGRRSKLKKGGRVGKKKQGYKARKDESIAMRVKKKRTKKQLKVSRSDSYGKFGKGKGKGKINRSGSSLVASSYD